ncbi:MAG TPA: hypothetical protein EYP24_03625, partial [bacterium (Candidatus Stahlbacteria)]|nr:hypothetical protein [Candidatus Stahlbacteria bacterium]
MIGMKIATCLLALFVTLLGDWILVDSAQIGVRVPAGAHCDLSLDPMGDSLIINIPPAGLTSLSQQAVARAPEWLKVELADNLSKLSDSLQDTLSKIIIGCEQKYLDEICFTTAHLAPQTLANTYFDPELILFNVLVLYANDGVLDYVRIIDFPDSSTVSYYVAESTPSGIDTFEVQLPKEIYYWFIVHPKLHKELPAYIDPNTGNPSPDGYFWRDYLFNHADPGYPLLRDSVIGVRTLWNSKRNSLDNGALGRATDWIQDVMEFVTYPHHDQPVRIYHLHKGTCSVHSYLSAATGRTLLIPTTVTAAYRYNHKWNEFYDRRWIQWEPVNTWMDYYPYDHWGGGDNIPGCFNWRGDGYIWTMVERYTPVCTLTVKVEDRNGIAIDGGRTIIDSP